jgi:hypothetical protein
MTNAAVLPSARVTGVLLALFYVQEGDAWLWFSEPEQTYWPLATIELQRQSIAGLYDAAKRHYAAAPKMQEIEEKLRKKLLGLEARLQYWQKMEDEAIEAPDKRAMYVPYEEETRDEL